MRSCMEDLLWLAKLDFFWCDGTCFGTTKLFDFFYCGPPFALGVTTFDYLLEACLSSFFCC